MSRIIEQSIFIDAPVDAVWRVVTEPDQIRNWFADELDLRVEPGRQGTMTFGTDPADQHHVQVSVEAVEPARSYSYRWSHPAGSTARAGNSTLVEFTLVPEGGGTRLRVTESGLDETTWPDDEKDTFEQDHLHGWEVHLRRLAEVVTRGAPAPR